MEQLFKNYIYKIIYINKYYIYITYTHTCTHTESERKREVSRKIKSEKYKSH